MARFALLYEDMLQIRAVCHFKTKLKHKHCFDSDIESNTNKIWSVSFLLTDYYFRNRKHLETKNSDLPSQVHNWLKHKCWDKQRPAKHLNKNVKRKSLITFPFFRVRWYHIIQFPLYSVNWRRYSNLKWFNFKGEPV